MVGNSKITSETLLILTDFDFEKPSGAGWSRIMNYSKALAAEQTEILLVSSKYDYSGNFYKNKIGNNTYFIIGKKLNYKSTFEDFHFRRHMKFIKKTYELVKINNDKTRTFFLYNANLAVVLISLLYLKLWKREKIFIERNELRTAIALNIEPYHNSYINFLIHYPFKLLRIISGFITDSLAIFFTGIMAISKRFERLYKKFNKNILRIPILIDKDNITKHENNRHNKRFTIGYFGWIGENKDGVFSLISAIKKLSADHSLELHLYGSIKSSKKEILDHYIDSKTIFYYGNIPQKNVINESLKYDLLYLVRPKNLQTLYGFSTKLGDYLLTAVPVLTSNVSDNCLFLKDGENAFILETKSHIDQTKLEAKISSIYYYNKDHLNLIGRKGKKTAIEHFDYRNYGKIIYEFLKK